MLLALFFYCLPLFADEAPVASFPTNAFQPQDQTSVSPTSSENNPSPPAAGMGADGFRPFQPHPRPDETTGNVSLAGPEKEVLENHQANAAKGKKAGNGLRVPANRTKNSAKNSETMLNVDYVDEPVLDVLRAIATAFKLSLIPDKDIGDVKVTIHLENLPVIEGVEKLCRSHGLEMLVDGNVYRIRKTRETSFSMLEIHEKLMNLDVQNRPAKDFLREFVEKTRINIVPGQDLVGHVTGHLKDVEPLDGFKALMEANNFVVRLKNGVYLVENGDPTDQNGAVRHPRSNQGFTRQGSGRADIDVHDGKVTLNLNNASLTDAISQIAEQAAMNFTLIGDISGNVTAQFKGVGLDDALSALLLGTRYAFLRRNGTLLIGDRNPNTPSGQALSEADLVYLKHIRAENIEKILPKSISPENIKVIKEQNAVLISGMADDIAQVKSFLAKVDISTPQVLMEVIVVEYNRNQGSEFGIENGLSKQKPSIDITGSMSGITRQWTKDGFQASIGIKPPNFDMNLRALESKSKAKILSMPKITTLNGNKADLKVSRTSYYKVSSVTKDGFQNNDFRTIDDGISIEITPWITKHGEVNVTISPSIKTSEVGDGETPPRVTNRSINTNVSLMDGETIALGGLLNSTQDNVRSFVPILGSIPLLGYLFSWRSANTSTQELVIYVTPHILDPNAQNVNLEDEFISLDHRSGFLQNSDFIKTSKPGMTNQSVEMKTPAPIVEKQKHLKPN